MLANSNSWRLNYGWGFPDINYSGNSVVTGPLGLGGISSSSLIGFGVVAVAAYILLFGAKGKMI